MVIYGLRLRKKFSGYWGGKHTTGAASKEEAGWSHWRRRGVHRQVSRTGFCLTLMSSLCSHDASPLSASLDSRSLAYVYGQEDSSAGSQHLTVEEARRIAVNIARLPDLVRRSD
jgi:hypothetical protein